MDNQPSFDRGFLIPIVIGVFSVVGIVFVFLAGRYNASRADISVTETETPFKYIFLGTEPGISTEPSPDESATPTLADEPPPFFTQEPPIVLTLITPLTTPGTPVPSAVVSPNAARTPTSASTPPLNPGTYDDIDFRLVYSGNWTNQTNVSGAYQGTLHVSNTLTNPGNSVTFRYIGQEVRLFYQTGPSLGVVRILLDSTQSQLDQSDTPNEWVITAPLPGTHTVTITHLSGGSVNLDYVIIPLGITPSPTSTGTN